MLEEAGQMIAFRNVIVHAYWEVDDEMVCRVITERVGPLRVKVQEMIDSMTSW